MLHQSPHTISETSSEAVEMETIKTRFGDITVDISKTVNFARGLLGMPDKHKFVLTSFPNPKMQQFMLLQSLDDKGLSFITLPLDMENGIIEQKDLNTACGDMQLNTGNVAILLIVNVHRNIQEVRLSVNARAPLIVDAERKIGVQYVFPNERYNVQHML